MSSRNEQRKDFELASLIETLKENSPPTRKGPSDCELCKDRQASNFCEVCEEIMCQECTKAHRGSKLSKDHDIKSTEHLLQSINSKIEIFGKKVTELNQIETRTQNELLAIKKRTRSTM
jgi:hypothetical protein